MFWLNVYVFLLLQTIDLSPSLFPVTLGLLYIFLYFSWHSLHFSSILQSYLTISVTTLIASVLNSAYDKLTISSSLSSIFWSFDLFFHLGHIFLSQHACYVVRGGALGIHQEQSNPHCYVVALYVGEASEREHCHLLGSRLTWSHFCCYPQANWAPFQCRFLGGWFCVHSRIFGVSPVNSPVRLGVSPTTATPTGFFSQVLRHSFPSVGTLGCMVCVASQFFLLIYPHANVGPPALPPTI